MSASTPNTEADDGAPGRGNAARPVLDVAAGILRDEAGRVLVGLRPVGKPWPGYWEFPGGKIEVGERPSEALTRELAEELGIRVHAARPLYTLDYAYPERTVRLHIHAVETWEGEPEGLEGQEIRWAAPEHLGALNLLPANYPMVRRLLAERLPHPRLLLIADPSRVPAGRFAPAIAAAVEGGLRWVQLRIKESPSAAGLAELQEGIAFARGNGARVFLNNAAPIPGLAVDGWHLTAARLKEGAPFPHPFGASCHDGDELALAARNGAAFALLSPVYPTATHPGAPALGLERFQGLAGSAALPVLALGGITPERVGSALAAGAAGVAVLSGILESPDPGAATGAFLDALRAGHAAHGEP